MRHAIAGAVVLAVAAVGAVTTDADASYDPVHRDWVFPRGLAYAPNEDSCFTYRCVWDAHHQGNGDGISLIITRFGDDWTFQPITHRRAHRLHYFFCQRPNVTCEGYDD